MNIIKRFQSNFGISSEDVEVERRKFIERIDETVFEFIEQIEHPFDYETIFKYICYQLGENATNLIKEASGFSEYYRTPELKTLTKQDFFKTLELICIIYNYFDRNEGSHNKQKIKVIDLFIKAALDICLLDIGIRWESGMFYKSGAKELDEKLIDETFGWLSKYPAEQNDLRNALKSYSEKDWGSVNMSCFTLIEGLARKILNNQMPLNKNIPKLQKMLNLAPNIKNLITTFYKWSNELPRHANEDRHDLLPEEIESYLYLTGLIARSILIKLNKKSPSDSGASSV